MAGRRLEREVVERLANFGDAGSSRVLARHTQAYGRKDVSIQNLTGRPKIEGKLELRTGNALSE